MASTLLTFHCLNIICNINMLVFIHGLCEALAWRLLYYKTGCCYTHEFRYVFSLLLKPRLRHSLGFLLFMMKSLILKGFEGGSNFCSNYWHGDCLIYLSSGQKFEPAVLPNKVKISLLQETETRPKFRFFVFLWQELSETKVPIVAHLGYNWNLEVYNDQFCYPGQNKRRR